LYLIKNKYSKKELEDKFKNIDIVYVGGGDTLKMLKTWRKLGVDRLLKKAYKSGVVMSGVSAGAICWFEYGCSDSLRFSDKNGPMIKVRGLGFVKGVFCPHYDVEPKRKKELKRMIENSYNFTLALDNCTAIEIIDDKYRIIKSKKTAKVYRTYWKKNKYFKDVINNQEFLLLKTLKDKHPIAN